jgi:SPP1 family predicted phage head-tail adaptor
MYHSERITLVDIRERTDERGDIVEMKREREVWADKKSASRAEFYQAQTAGMKAEVTFTLWQSDYCDEERIIHTNTVYDVIRTYETGKDKVEIVCKRGVR